MNKLFSLSAIAAMFLVCVSCAEEGNEINSQNKDAPENSDCVRIVTNDYAVSLQLAENTPPSDVMLGAYTLEDTVVINAISLSARPLVCYVKDINVGVTGPIVSDNINTFKIYDISSDICVIIGYTTNTVSFLDKIHGTVITPVTLPLGECLIPRPEDPKYASADGDFFVGWYTSEDYNTAWNFYTDVVTKDMNLYAKWISGAIPGVFTVADPDGKPDTGDERKVVFSKGNLYWDGKEFKNEEEQWRFATSWNESYVSHFFWTTAPNIHHSYSMYNNANNETPSDIFFTNSDIITANPDFSVNGQKGLWRVLSGTSSGEWDYLLNRRTMMVSGMPRYVNKSPSRSSKNTDGKFYGLFIYPDNYSGAEVGDETMDSWEEINAAGIVFLPAAEYRWGDEFDAYKFNSSPSSGVYWSSTAEDENNANCLSFGNNVGYYMQIETRTRYSGRSVRLVAEYK